MQLPAWVNKLYICKAATKCKNETDVKEKKQKKNENCLIIRHDGK